MRRRFAGGSEEVGCRSAEDLGVEMDATAVDGHLASEERIGETDQPEQTEHQHLTDAHVDARRDVRPDQLDQ